MTTPEFDDESIPIPSSPFFANWGTRDGLILYGGAPVMGVLGTRDGSEGPIGIAWPTWSIPSKRGPVQMFRLEVGKVELEGSWVCRCREFVRIGDAAESV